MNVAELTPEQQVIIENVITEFKKLNNPTVTKNGLIDIDSILSEDKRRVEKRKSIELKNAEIKIIRAQRLQQDCDKLNVDLCKLGLKATHNCGYMMTINCLTERADANNCIMITYNTTQKFHDDIHIDELFGIQLSCQIDTNGIYVVNFSYDTIEELIPNIQKRIFRLYEKYGKKHL